jgi:hypothetical protein
MTILHVISLPSCCLFAFWLLSDPSIGLVKTVLTLCLFVCIYISVCVCVCVRARARARAHVRETDGQTERER